MLSLQSEAPNTFHQGFKNCTLETLAAKKADSYCVHKKPHFLTGNAYQILCTRMYTDVLYPKPHGADDLWWVFQFLTIEDLCIPIFQATCLLLSHFEDKHDTYFAGLQYDHCKTSTTWKHQE
jgi:hypothetical protein